MPPRRWTFTWIQVILYLKSFHAYNSRPSVWIHFHKIFFTQVKIYITYHYSQNLLFKFIRLPKIPRSLHIVKSNQPTIIFYRIQRTNHKDTTQSLRFFKFFSQLSIFRVVHRTVDVPLLSSRAMRGGWMGRKARILSSLLRTIRLGEPGPGKSGSSGPIAIPINALQLRETWRWSRWRRSRCGHPRPRPARNPTDYHGPDTSDFCPIPKFIIPSLYLILRGTCLKESCHFQSVVNFGKTSLKCL